MLPALRLISVRAGRLYKACPRFGSSVQSAKTVPAGSVKSAKPRLQRPDLRYERSKEESKGYFLLIIPISAFGLGYWQIERKKWKEDLIAKLEYRMKAEAVPLPNDLDELQSLEYRRVWVRGHFDHSQEMFLGPRSRIDKGESSYSGQLMSTASNDSSGYLVITPFVISGTGQRILVNRGWVPFGKKNPATRSEGQITGEIELEGIVRLTEKRPQFSIANKPLRNIWFYRDLDLMAQTLDCSPVFLDACVESTVPGGPIGGQTRASLRNEHLSYIITWFSLGTATSIMWYMKYIKKAY